MITNLKRLIALFALVACLGNIQAMDKKKEDKSDKNEKINQKHSKKRPHGNVIIDDGELEYGDSKENKSNNDESDDDVSLSSSSSSSSSSSTTSNKRRKVATSTTTTTSSTNVLTAPSKANDVLEVNDILMRIFSYLADHDNYGIIRFNISPKVALTCKSWNNTAKKLICQSPKTNLIVTKLSEALDPLIKQTLMHDNKVKQVDENVKLAVLKSFIAKIHNLTRANSAKLSLSGEVSAIAKYFGCFENNGECIRVVDEKTQQETKIPLAHTYVGAVSQILNFMHSLGLDYNAVFVALVGHNANLFQMDTFGNTLLHVAARYNVDQNNNQNRLTLDVKLVANAMQRLNMDLTNGSQVLYDAQSPENALIVLQQGLNPNGYTNISGFTPTLINSLVRGNATDYALQLHPLARFFIRTDRHNNMPAQTTYEPTQANPSLQNKLAENQTPINFNMRLGIGSHANYEHPYLGKYIFSTSTFSYTPLHCAASANSLNDVKNLLAHQADPNAATVTGLTPLHLAARDAEDIKVVEALLTAGADINAHACNGQTPLFMAIFYNRNENLAKFLLQKGAYSKKKYAADFTLLHITVQINADDKAKLLIKHGAQLEAKDISGRTPLIYAAEKNKTALVKLFSCKNADVNARDGDDRTALHYAAKHFDPLMISVILLRKPNPIIRDYEGKTPLHWAAKCNNRKAIDALLAYGVDTTIVDNDKKLAEELTLDSVIQEAIKKARKDATKKASTKKNNDSKQAKK